MGERLMRIVIAANADIPPLHTADPGDSGTRSTSECLPCQLCPAGGAFDRWLDCLVGRVYCRFQTSIPQLGRGRTTVSHFSTGKTGGGATEILASGTVTPNITIAASGVIPRLDTATVITVY
jgi:hypothetical protein